MIEKEYYGGCFGIVVVIAVLVVIVVETNRLCKEQYGHEWESQGGYNYNTCVNTNTGELRGIRK